MVKIELRYSIDTEEIIILGVITHSWNNLSCASLATIRKRVVRDMYKV